MTSFDDELDKYLIEAEIDALLAERSKIKARNREIARRLKVLRTQLSRMIKS